MWAIICDLFTGFMGKGLIVTLFLCCLVYLFWAEKDKSKKITFVFMPVTFFVLFFNPLFGKLFYKYIDDEIYYRIMWLIPVSVVFAYTLVKLSTVIKGRWLWGYILLASVIIGISGNYVYSNIYYHKAENVYHIPQNVVDVCDMIEVPGREVMALFPAEMLQYVRQYNPYICMPYGRDLLMLEKAEYGNIKLEIMDAMESDPVNLKKLMPYIAEDRVAYIILPEGKKVDGELEDYNFEVFGRVDGYVIYKDITQDLSY